MKEEDKDNSFLKEPNEAYDIVDNYTLEDLEKIERKEGYTYELLDGVICLQGAPRVQHEEIVANIIGQLWMYLKGKPCKVFGSKMGYAFMEKNVKAHEHSKINQYVEPDVTVICNSSILKDDGAYGVPTVAIEVTSPSTAKRDYIDKYRIYEKYGVKEYCIISIENNMVISNRLSEQGKYISEEYSFSDEIPIEALGGFKLKLV